MLYEVGGEWRRDVGYSRCLYVFVAFESGFGRGRNEKMTLKKKREPRGVIVARCDKIKRAD